MGLLRKAEDSSASITAKDISEAVIETTESADAEYTDKKKSGEPDILKEKIARYHVNCADFHCILLEIPASLDMEEKAGFCKKVSEMINVLGIVIVLSSGRPLILIPKMLDRELITNRLSKSLNTIPLLSFETNSPEKVIDCIQSLI